MKLDTLREYQGVVMLSELSRAAPLTDIETKLLKYGLQEHEVDLLMDRYVSKMSFSEIAQKEGYVNKQAAWRLLTDLVSRLKRSPSFKKLLK